jgi:type II secretory pathway component PulF
MPTFQYHAPPGAGAPNGGAVIDAPDRATAVRLLLQRGITPTRLEEVAGSRRAEAAPTGGQGATAGATRGPRLPGTSGMSRAEMASFIRELATAIEAGLPLIQALRTIQRQGRSPKQKAMLGHVISQVEAGKSLADAARSWGRPFTDLTTNLIHAGEASGRLGEVLDQSATLLDRDVKLRRSLLAATLYPIILTVLVTGAVIVVVTWIVPQVLGPLAGQLKESDLPLPTRVVQGGAYFFGHYWWMVLLGAGATLFGIARVYATPGPRLSIDRSLIKVPILGRLLRDVAVARFTRTLGTLVSAGLPALTALRITKGTLGNKAMEGEIEFVCDEVAHGKTIAEPMERSGYFPPLLVQIVGVGERSGRLPQMLNQAAGAFEDRTESSLKLFTTALPPILVVILAGVVGFVVAAILLPLLQLQEHIG